MFKKFLYLYIICGLIGLGLFIYELASTWPNPSYGSLLLDILPAILFLYLSYKTYHEKKDQEMM